MSLLSKESVGTLAEAAGLVDIPDEVAGALASDLEYRLRELAQVQ